MDITNKEWTYEEYLKTLELPNGPRKKFYLMSIAKGFLQHNPEKLENLKKLGCDEIVETVFAGLGL